MIHLYNKIKKKCGIIDLQTILYGERIADWSWNTHIVLDPASVVLDIEHGVWHPRLLIQSVTVMVEVTLLQEWHICGLKYEHYC